MRWGPTTSPMREASLSVGGVGADHVVRAGGVARAEGIAQAEGAVVAAAAVGQSSGWRHGGQPGWLGLWHRRVVGNGRRERKPP